MNQPAPAPSPPALPVSLAANPKLSSWLKFSSNGQVTISPGKVEIGQGIVTALAQIAADELDIDLSRVQMIRASTATSPNEGVTSGSLSIQQSGRALRHACAEVRRIFLQQAAERLGVDIDALDIEDGTISGPGNVRTSYWELAEEVSLDRDATPGVTPKIASRRALAGNSIQRIDIPDKVLGRPRFIHDQALAGMLHGRVLRPENARAKLIELKEDGARAVAGLVAIVRDGSFAGVVSETEHGAEAALNALRKGASWSDGEPLPDENDLASFLKAQPSESTIIDKKTAASPGTAARTIRRQYTRPYIAHASIAPSCAMAQWHGDRVHVWTHSQGVYLLRADLALVLKLPVENITVEHMEGAGCYGHNAADDVALDAVLLAKAAGGRPVRVQWSRQGEMSDAPFGAAMAIEIEADLDAQGEIIDWRHSIWGNGHVARPGRAAQPALLAGFELANPFPRMISTNPPQANGGGGDRNSIPLYDFPSWRIESHRLTTMPIRTSALRTLGGQGNVFAIESILDEIAAERGEDPVAFRLRHLRDERAKDVIRAVAARAKWKPEKQPGIGHGVGFARYKNTGAYCAAIAEIEGAEEISVRKLTLAVDVGEAINPDGVINQIEGGAIQATSWVLKERVRFDRQRITSTSWTEYPILRFSEVPDVEVEVIQRSGYRPGRRRRGCPWPGYGGHRQRRIRRARRAGARSADHARQDHCRDGIDLMSSLNILSGGAAQGLVGSLTPAFKAQTGFDIAGEFGAVGVMADKLRKGTPADIVILTAALVAKLAEEKLVVATSIADVGLVETALAVRTGDPLAAVRDAADLREALLASDAIFVPDTKASTAGIHVANVLQQLGIADEVAARLRIFPNGATAMRELAASEARRPIGCTQSTEIISTKGRNPVRFTAAGLRTCDHVHGRHHGRRRPPATSPGPDRPVDRCRTT